MDAFFASVEQRDFPELKGKPLAVGGGHRGVVAAASYEARKFGVKSAMSSKLALQKCPHIIFVKPRFARYKEVSMQIREIFYEYTDLVEPLSLDEAFLDVTENKVNNPMAHQIAQEIRQKILEKTGLTASAGISINKFLAKIASDINKPNGQKTIHPQQVLSFLEELPIQKFFGIGEVTAKKMHQLGIYKGKDLKALSENHLHQFFGKSGRHFYQIVRGIHLSEVKPDRVRKSIAVERTFDEDIATQANDLVFEKIQYLIEELLGRTQKYDILGKTLTLKIKYEDFTLYTRSKTLLQYFHAPEIERFVKELWQARPFDKPVRLLGISLSNLNTEQQKNISIQLTLPFEEQDLL